MGSIRTIVMLPLGNSLFSSIRCPPQLTVPALVVFFFSQLVSLELPTKMAGTWQCSENIQVVNWKFHWLFLLARYTVICLKNKMIHFMHARKKDAAACPSVFEFCGQFLFACRR
jgi:hypothetical protein